MVVIGGAVAACLLDVPSDCVGSASTLHDYYHTVAYPTSDIDIYFYGLSAREFCAKVHRLYAHLKQRNGDVMLVHTPYTLTFCSEWPRRHVQVVLTQFARVEELLYMVDIDCTAVAYNGRTVLASPRAMLSLNTRTIVGQDRHSALRGPPAYESRLWKYGLRGFRLADRGLGTKYQVNEEMLQLGRERLTNLTGKRGEGLDRGKKPEITGLMLLLVALRFPEVTKDLWFFKLDDGNECLPYGPKWSLSKIKEKIQGSEVVEDGYHRGRKARYEVALLPEAMIAEATIKRPVDAGAPEWLDSLHLLQEEIATAPMTD